MNCPTFDTRPFVAQHAQKPRESVGCGRESEKEEKFAASKVPKENVTSKLATVWWYLRSQPKGFSESGIESFWVFLREDELLLLPCKKIKASMEAQQCFQTLNIMKTCK